MRKVPRDYLRWGIWRHGGWAQPHGKKIKHEFVGLLISFLCSLWSNCRDLCLSGPVTAMGLVSSFCIQIILLICVLGFSCHMVLWLRILLWVGLDSSILGFISAWVCMAWYRHTTHAQKRFACHWQFTFRYGLPKPWAVWGHFLSCVLLVFTHSHHPCYFLHITGSQPRTSQRK